jgi:tubulin polyglutamylase TTLL6/13
MCFHILGFDIMLDNKCKPYLLEVNHSPSFTADSPLDEQVKGGLIRDTIKLLGLSKQRKMIYRRNLQAMIDHRTRSGKFIRLPPELKEKLRAEFEVVRNEYELNNLGSFE